MTTRRALLLGFGAILVLWLTAAYDHVRRLRELEGRAAASSQRFTAGEELLANVMARVLLGAVYVRDVALEVEPDEVPFHWEEWRRRREDIDRALARYVRMHVDSNGEREHWTRLEAELDEYWQAIAPLLSRSAGRDMTRTRELMRQQALSKGSILQMAETLRLVNRAGFERQQAEVDAMYEELYRGVWIRTGLMATFGLLIAVGSTRYAGALESRIRAQHEATQRHERELQDLSARLVQAQELERRRLARDLHDEVGGALTAVKIELAAVDRDLSGVDPLPRRRLREARSITDRTLHTVRDLSQILHPGMLDDFGLVETVRWYVRGFTGRTGLKTQVTATESFGRMPPDLEITAYRIVQEALTNVAKHARATTCLVRLERRSDRLVVTVEDDGRGLDLSGDAPGRGFGLVSMRERVAGFSGRFHVERMGDSGTRLTAEFPLLAGADGRAHIDRGRIPAALRTGDDFGAVGEEAAHPAG